MKKRATTGLQQQPSIRLRIQSESDATRSLIEASRFAVAAGFGAHDANTIATAVSELARNILKYAGQGDVWLERVQSEHREGIRITARDRGPGIEDVDTAMQDHFSSSGTLGLGLPGVRRMMDEFSILSAPGEGTCVTSAKWRALPGARQRTRISQAVQRAVDGRRYAEGRSGGLPASSKDASGEQPALDCAFFVRPCLGERVSGDGVFVKRRGHILFLAIIDALGHGPGAHQIAARADSFLREAWSSDVVVTVRRLHDALRGTEGAAAGIAVVDEAEGTVSYSAVGNTAFRLFGPRPSRLLAVAGTLGHQIRSPREQRVKLGSDDVLLLYTDGVKDRFELKDYPQLQYQSARTISRTVVERFGKAHDDASCVAVRYAR